MPLYRRLARRGFSNYPFKKEYQVISVGEISTRFADGETVSLATLLEKKVVKGKDILVKILADGEIDKKVIVDGVKLSGSAAEKIKAAGGEIK